MICLILKNGGDRMKDNVQVKRIVEEIKIQLMELLQKKLQSVILFGSYARGDNTTESDMDIMLILNCPKENALLYRKDISKIASRIGLKYDVVISILFRTNEEFTKGMHYLPFYQNIVREGISIYG